MTHGLYDHLSDAELTSATKMALDDAHNAPKSVLGKENYAFGTKSKLWMTMLAEMKRRKLNASL